MQNNIVVINAFEPEDFFIGQLSQSYDNAAAEAGAFNELLIVNSMYFSSAAFPEQYTYDTLEPDLQRCVDAIKNAAVLALFTSYRPGTNPVSTDFISRLFHLKMGRVNSDIWGNITAHDKLVRIVTVIEDRDAWRRYKFHRESATLPVHSINFRLFGFGKVLTSTFGYLEGNLMNEYGLKQLARMHRFGTEDVLNRKI